MWGVVLLDSEIMVLFFSSILDKDVAEGALSKAVKVVLIPPHPLVFWILLQILFLSYS